MIPARPGGFAARLALYKTAAVVGQGVDLQLKRGVRRNGELLSPFDRLPSLLSFEQHLQISGEYFHYFRVADLKFKFARLHNAQGFAAPVREENRPACDLSVKEDVRRFFHRYILEFAHAASLCVYRLY